MIVEYNRTDILEPYVCSNCILDFTFISLLLFSLQDTNIKFYAIPASDELGFNISQYFESTAKHIDQSLKEGGMYLGLEHPSWYWNSCGGGGSRINFWEFICWCSVAANLILCLKGGITIVKSLLTSSLIITRSLLPLSWCECHGRSLRNSANILHIPVRTKHFENSPITYQNFKQVVSFYCSMHPFDTASTVSLIWFVQLYGVFKTF